MELEEAINRTLDGMPEDFLIKPYLQANRVEVQKMLLTEYDERATMELFKEEGRAEGEANERLKNIRTFWSLVQDKILSREEAARRNGMTPEEFDEQVSIAFSESHANYSET